jgi:hypothetical protein
MIKRAPKRGIGRSAPYSSAARIVDLLGSHHEHEAPGSIDFAPERRTFG